MNKTCTPEQAKRLKEMGVEQWSEKWWVAYNQYSLPIHGYAYMPKTEDYAAFDTDELLAMLPDDWLIGRHGTSYKVSDFYGNFTGYRGETAAIALSEMIIDCLYPSCHFNGFSVAEINERIKKYNQ